jgi:hypothetical protein
MAYQATPLLALAPLFTALLSGCGTLFCGNDTYENTVELTPEEYAQWSKGIQPDAMTTGDDTTDPTGGDTAGGTAGDTGSDTASGDTDETLTEQDICKLVCAATYMASGTKSCTIEEMDMNGNIPVVCVLNEVCEGRRHACVRSHGSSDGKDPAANWLARAAHDEAASVHAFLALADELTAHGASPELLARIITAADDERRHAALVTDLALQHGATIPTPIIAPAPPRDLLALAVENMVEGCVRETWAALSAAHQSHHALTPELRNLYQTIAADETRHAELAWSIHTWLIGQLSAASQAMVAAARRQAIHQLRTSLAALPDEPALLALGVPARHTALHLIAGLDAALWSQAA